MRKYSTESINKIEEFKSLGFARSSTSLMRYVRKNNEQYTRIFRPGSFVKAGKGSIKYSAKDIFGHGHFSHIFDVRFAERFVDYLVNTFLSNNPEPDTNIRKAFTRILHNNGLHWECCQHTIKEKNEEVIDDKE